MAKDKTITTSGLTVPEVFKIGDTEVNKETLLAQREADVKLVINGVDDKEGYKKAHALRAQYRTVRTTLEKHRKDVSAPFQAYVKQLKETTDELGKIAQVGEDYFDTIMTEIDDEKARIAKEKELAEQKRIAGRINELVALGATFDGENYTFPYSETFMVSSDEVNSFSDMEMFEVMEDAKQLYSTEQQRISDELLKQQEVEEARLAEVEAQRLLKLANSLEAIKLQNKQNAIRLKELKLLGFIPCLFEGQDGFEWLNSKGVQHFHIFLKSVETVPDGEWEKIIAQVEAYEEPLEVKPKVVPVDEVVEAYLAGSHDEPDYSGVIAACEEEAKTNPSIVTEVEESVHDVYQPLFDLMTEHGLTLLQGEMDEIINMVRWMDGKDFHSVILKFDSDQKYTDSDVTPKTFLRVFPEQFELGAINDCVVMSQGTVQSLGWAIIKR